MSTLLLVNDLAVLRSKLLTGARKPLAMAHESKWGLQTWE